MKHKISLILFLVSAMISNAQTDVGGPYFSDQTWTLAGSPYRLISDVQIPIGYELTIEPGVHVEYTGPYKLLVKGLLQANGTQSDSIKFYCSSGIHDNVSMLSVVDATSNVAELSYCRFDAAEVAIKLTESGNGALVAENCSFTSNKIINESPSTYLSFLNSDFVDVYLENNHDGDYSKINLEQCNLVSSQIVSTVELETSFPGVSVIESNAYSSEFLVGCGGCYSSNMQLTNVDAQNCVFSSVYGTLSLWIHAG